MTLTDEEIEELQNRPFSQNDWLWFYTKAVEAAVIEKANETIAAQAAVIADLRTGYQDCVANSLDPDEVQWAQAYLDVNPDSTKILDDVRKAERERCVLAITKAWHTDPCYLHNLTNAIRAMED